MHILTYLLLLGAGITAPPAIAQVFKCAGINQQTVYQDQPCPEGRALRDFASDPPTLSVIPTRPVPGTTSRVTAPSSARPKATAARRDGPRQSGDPAERRYVHLGMHEGEVISRIGQPDMKSGGGSRKLARWTYMPVPGDAQTLTTVVFEYGKVVEVERKVMK